MFERLSVMRYQLEVTVISKLFLSLLTFRPPTKYLHSVKRVKFHPGKFTIVCKIRLPLSRIMVYIIVYKF